MNAAGIARTERLTASSITAATWGMSAAATSPSRASPFLRGRRPSESARPLPELARREYGSPPRLLGSVLRWNAFRMTAGH